MEIPVKKNERPKINEIDFDHLEFGKYTSDHMLVANYKNGRWSNAEILPYGDIQLAPTALCLHYGQTVFEGMKAFKTKDGSISVFRIAKHYERLKRSLERMCMAAIPEELFTEGILQLIQADANWVPEGEGESLYIRPFMIATEERFGVKISSEYMFIIITGPVPVLFSKPIRVKVETHFVRAAKGGVGYAKCGGNYGAAYYPTDLARKEGYDAVLWTDSKVNEFIEESGTMNVMFIINNILVTPPLSDSILDGITRDSILDIAKHMGMKIEERLITYHEIENAIQNKTLQEAFGTGTAAVVAPIAVIGLDGKDLHLPEYDENNFMFRAKKQLESMRRGYEDDIFGWNTIIK